jgi:hypothetical protein
VFRCLRIFLVLVLAGGAVGLLEGVLGVGDNGSALSMDGVIHLCLGLVAMLVVALSDREFFGLD